MKLLKTSLIATALIAAGVIAAPSQAAGTDTANFEVKITITESCDIHTVAPTNIDFGSHARSTGAPVTQTGTITVKCSTGTPYTIGLNGGAHSAGSTTSPVAGERRMANGVVLLPYDLYRNAGFTDFWGNTTGSLQAGTGNASNQPYTVYGRVPSTDFPAGTYIDSVTATITY